MRALARRHRFAAGGFCVSESEMERFCVKEGNVYMRRSLFFFPPLFPKCMCVSAHLPPVLLPSALWPQCLAEQKRKQLNDGTVCPLAGSP